jgi:hypothetical protein
MKNKILYLSNMIHNTVLKECDKEKLYYETMKNFNFFLKKSLNGEEHSDLQVNMSNSGSHENCCQSIRKG